MRRDCAVTSLLALILFGISRPSFAATPIAVGPFEQLLASSRGDSDSALARQISGLQLTQRLTALNFANCEKALPGPKARLALVALADAAAFLPPPAEDIPAISKPDGPSQREIVSSAVRYAEKSIHDMPNFFATRLTTRFQGDIVTEVEADSSGDSDYQRFHLKDKSNVTVLYRDGEEVVQADSKKNAAAEYYGLNGWGVFGPLLGATVSDALKGKVSWSRWESGAAGALAVFHYAVPEGVSHYDVKYCCVSMDRWTSSFSRMPGYYESAPAYHGELSIDPANGSIVRLVIQTELPAIAPIVRDDLVVEYGPVVIGGLTYICPIKSMTISRVETSGSKAANGYIPMITSLNDVVYTDYHVFRAQVRVLNADRVPLQQ
jgi:hypothetical protein